MSCVLMACNHEWVMLGERANLFFVDGQPVYVAWLACRHCPAAKLEQVRAVVGDSPSPDDWETARNPLP